MAVCQFCQGPLAEADAERRITICRVCAPPPYRCSQCDTVQSEWPDNCPECGQKLPRFRALGSGQAKVKPTSDDREAIGSARIDSKEPADFKGDKVGGDLFGPPAKWSVGLGIALPVLGWLASGDFSTEGIVALSVVIPIWMGVLRLIIFIGQLVTGRRDVDDASVDSDITTAERLRQLKRLLDEDVISESEFAAKKAELLKDL